MVIRRKSVKLSSCCGGVGEMERYEYVKDIGSGNFGVAKLVRDKRTKELFAVKLIERGQQKVSLNLFVFVF